MCESTILCHIHGPQVDLSTLSKCHAGQDFVVNKIGASHEWWGSVFDGIIAGSDVRMRIYSDDSASVTYSRWNVLIIAAGCVRSWVENEYGNARTFADVSWDDDESVSGDVINRGLKAMLIYCMGEQNAKDWFVSHGGSVAMNKFCISDGERQNLIRLLVNAGNNGENVRMIQFLEGLKPVEQVSK